MTDLAIKRDVPHSFQETIDRVTKTLQAEGFGVLTTIDLAAKMQEKLGREMPPYVILGACNPALAWDAVHAVYDLGVLLPCNVCVYERDGQVTIAAMEPEAALGLVEDAKVHAVACDASARLKRAVAAV